MRHGTMLRCTAQCRRARTDGRTGRRTELRHGGRAAAATTTTISGVFSKYRMQGGLINNNALGRGVDAQAAGRCPLPSGALPRVLSSPYPCRFPPPPPQKGHKKTRREQKIGGVDVKEWRWWGGRRGFRERRGGGAGARCVADEWGARGMVMGNGSGSGSGPTGGYLNDARE